MKQTLHSIFGLNEFRHGQEEIIQAISAGRDVLAVMATGSGKSLCYQLPAVATGKRCLVISPLISLMNDQVSKLHLLNIPAAAVHSSMEDEEAGQALQDWEDKRLVLLYVSPERVVTPEFRSFLKKNPPDYISVDEAHCIAQWGHDFREEYRALGLLKKEFDCPVIALTATATPEVQREIVSSLALKSALIRIHGFYRPNLKLRARMVGGKKLRYEEITRLLAEITEGASIVYCNTRKFVEELTEHLRDHKILSYAYHAGLSAEVREASHRHFQEDNRVVLVATNAFGMGVDRPDVRAVIHAQMPGTLEAYYQEAGRAGRDGKASTCLLFFGSNDSALQEFFIQTSLDLIPPEKQAALRLHREEKLKLMQRYSYTQTCRQKALMDYFGDSEELPNGCGCCDNCGETESITISPELKQEIRMILSGIARFRTSFGKGVLIDCLMGKPNRQGTLYRHDQLSTFGILKEKQKTEISTLIDLLIRQGYILQDGFKFPTLTLTAEGLEVMKDTREATLPKQLFEELSAHRKGRNRRDRQRGERSPVASPQEHLHPELWEALRKWRAETARKKNVPPYTLFWDRTIDDLCLKKPSALSELVSVFGIGERKCASFGEELLQIIREQGA